MAKKKAKKKKARPKAKKSTSQAQAGSSSTQVINKPKKPEVKPYPQAGQKVIEFENAIDNALNLVGDEPKRGRGRPRKEDQQAAQTEIDIKVVAQAIQIPFDLWALSQNVEQLKLSADEAILIARPAKQLLDHYMPNVPEIAWAWVSLSAAGYSIIQSRLLIIAEIKKQKQSSDVSSVDGNPTGAQDDNSQRRRDQGRSRSGFPNIEEIKNPVI